MSWRGLPCWTIDLDAREPTAYRPEADTIPEPVTLRLRGFASRGGLFYGVRWSRRVPGSAPRSSRPCARHPPRRQPLPVAAGCANAGIAVGPRAPRGTRVPAPRRRRDVPCVAGCAPPSLAAVGGSRHLALVPDLRSRGRRGDRHGVALPARPGRLDLA